MRLNRSSEWKVMTIGNSIELSLFNFECPDILCAWIGPPSEKLWPIEFLECFHYSISSVSIHYAPKSNLRVKSYNHLNFLRASVVHFLASGYIVGVTHEPESKFIVVWICQGLPCLISSVSIYYSPKSYIWMKFMIIWISWVLSLFNFMRLQTSWASIIHPIQKLRPFEFAESLRVQFRVSRYIMRMNQIFEGNVMTIWISWELPFFNLASWYICGLNHTPKSKVMAVWICWEPPCSISSVSIYDVP